MGLRIAIYARYSTALQSDRSIEDQVELCRSVIDREGYREVAVYEDRKLTSETLIGRVGLDRLLNEAAEQKFDAVLVECVDRISREPAGLHQVANTLRFLGIEIIAASDGLQDEIKIGVRGLVGAIFLKDLRDKIHRGMSGNIREGLSAGGKAYGYFPVPGKPGELKIEQSEADVIRRIFRDYSNGKSPRDIAHALNAEGVLPPRRARWNASTLNGSADRGYGILRNSIYAGILVWNRVKMVRDPRTGKRISRVKPQEEWKFAEVPHLRIVDEKLWDSVQRRLASQSHAKSEGKSTRQPARPFSGLLTCGCCGGGMAIHDRSGRAIRIRCSTARESGSCTNTRKFRLDDIESEIFSSLRDHLMHPAYIEEFIRAYDQERRTLLAEPKMDRTKLVRAVTEAGATFERLLALFEKGILDGADGEKKLVEAKTRLQSAKAELSALDIDQPEVAFDAATPARYISAIESLVASMTATDRKPEPRARDTIRALVSEIIVSPTEDDQVFVEVRGRISALVANSGNQLGGAVVAEEGLEPPTRGL